MFVPHPSRSVRFARSWLRVALCFWPAKSRQWGCALVAKLDSIHDPFEGVRWAIGGTLLFARALVSHFLAWLRLSVGARLNGDVLRPSAQLPHRSRLFSAALIVATAVILCLPQGRQVKMSWGFSDFNRDVPELERIGRQADRENDARTLAFAGLALSTGACSPSRNRLEAIYYAERAVAIDPSLAWIYSSAFPAFELRTHQSEWLARVKAAIPSLC